MTNTKLLMLGGALLTACVVGTIAAQDSAGQIAGVATLRTTQQSSEPTIVSRAVTSTGLNYLNLRSEYQQQDKEIAAAARELRQAKSASDEAAARDKLTELLSQDYDDRLAQYESYIDELQAKLQEMRTKLQRRRDAKREMLELRIKVLEAEADDLGWPSRVSGRFPTLLRPDAKGQPAWLPQ